MTVKTLKVLGWVVGISLIALGVGRLFLPMTTMPGSGLMNPTVDAETRAAGALLVGFGAAYIWVVRQAVVPVVLLRFLAAVMALLAASRIVSIIAVGMPHPFVIAGFVVEVIAAGLTYWYSTMSVTARD